MLSRRMTRLLGKADIGFSPQAAPSLPAKVLVCLNGRTKRQFAFNYRSAAVSIGLETVRRSASVFANVSEESSPFDSAPTTRQLIDLNTG